MNSKLKGVIKIRLLGNLEMRHHERVLNLHLVHSKKLWLLLTYLVVNRHKVTTIGDIVETLWGNTEINAPEGALRNLVYRLRKVLKEALGSSEEYILYTGGTYRWNNSIPCILDIEVFEQGYKKLKQGLESEEQELQQLRKLFILYKGKLLNCSYDSHWLTYLEEYYQTMYSDCIERMILILMKKQDYEHVQQVCRHALTFEPIDEKIHEYLIEALLKMGAFQKAFKHYQEAKALFKKQLDVQPSRKMQALYEALLKALQHHHASLQEVLLDLGSTMEQQEGPICCEYNTFRLMYQLISRGMEYSDRPAYMVLINVNSKNQQPLKEVLLEDVLDYTTKVLCGLLRKNDVLTRLSKNQIILIVQHDLEQSAQSMLQSGLNQVSYSKGEVDFEIHIQPIGKMTLSYLQQVN